MPSEFASTLDMVDFDYEPTPTSRSKIAEEPDSSSGRTGSSLPSPASPPGQSLAKRATVDMTILVQDPALIGSDGRPVSTAVAVPSDRLELGPRSHRFHVVDVDTATGASAARARLAWQHGWEYRDHFVGLSYQTAVEDAVFHAQNVYAVAARTLALFERHLGRRVEWAFGSPQLYLIPHAFAEGNAYYSKDDRAVLFGYLPAGETRQQPVFTCLSHDIVAHEVTHAILDGLRARFIEPGLPDQLAYHEALSDIVALLSVLAVPELVESALRAGLDDPNSERMPRSELTPTKLRESRLLGLAEQLGSDLRRGSADALRRSITSIKPGAEWRKRAAYKRAHRRGEVVVAAIMHTLVRMWDERLAPYRTATAIDITRAAEEGARSAEHLLGMVVRATDYLPPVELEFEDVVDAILVADEIVAPDDKHNYRGAVKAGFERYDIRPPDRREITLKDLKERPRYRGLNRAMLGSSHDEVYRFIWHNPGLLAGDIDLDYYLGIERVLATRRTGPDGLVVDEIVADYIQMLDASVGELKGLGIEAPEGTPEETMVQLLGGGVLAFDQFGRLRRHVTKPLLDAKRQARRLEHLIEQRQADSRGRFGFSYLTPRGQRFANLHQPVSDEAW